MGKIYIGDTLISITPGSTEAEAAYTKSQSDQKFTDLIDGAPGTLDTLNEIAQGIGDLKLNSLADVEIKDGKVGTVDTISGGAEAVAGTYTGVPVTSSGSGTGASFDVVLTGGLINTVGNKSGQGPARPDDTYVIGASQYTVTRGGSTITTATGATFSIVTVSGIATITITDPGSGYFVNDTITVPNANLGNVSGVPDLTFDVTTTRLLPSITVNTAGSGYVVDETLSMIEESLGYDGSGGTGTNPLTFDVATLADAGIMIYDATAAGTKADPHFINKTLSEIGIVTSASPVITGDFTVDTNTLFVDSTNNRVGIGTTTPGVKFVVQGNSRFNGDLTVNTNTLFADSTNNRVGIGTASPLAGSILSVSGKSTFAGDILLPNTNKAFTKQNCYNKTGAIRLQKAAIEDDEISMRYEGAASNNFTIQQISAVSGTKANRGQIKFIAAIPAGQTNATQSSIRLDAQNVDVGFSNTNLIKLFSDTNVSANKKIVFTDTRTASEGLQFYHTGVRPNTLGEAGRDAVQMGMYGSSGDSNIGEFKITHKVGAGANTDVLSIASAGASVTIHKDATISGDLTLSSALKFGASGKELKEYDYGTFTPKLALKSTSSVFTEQSTHAVQEGYYVKIGRLVTVNIIMSVTHFDTAFKTAPADSQICVTGIPHTAQIAGSEGPDTMIVNVDPRKGFQNLGGNAYNGSISELTPGSIFFEKNMGQGRHGPVPGAGVGWNYERIEVNDFHFHPFDFTGDGVKAFAFQISGTYITDDDV